MNKKILFFCVAFFPINAVRMSEIKPRSMEMSAKIVKEYFEKAEYCFQNNVNSADARYLYERLAEQNVDLIIKARATYRLGVIFLNGIGIQKDYERAKNYLENAADQNIQEVQSNALMQLGKLHYLYLQGNRNKNKARLYFIRVTNLPSADAGTIKAAGYWLSGIGLSIE